MIDWKKVFSIYATIGIPLLYLYDIFLAYAFPKTFQVSFPLLLLGILLSLVGSCLWIMSYMHLGWSFGVLPQKQKRVTKGLYKYFNHPMYVGIYITFLGLALANASLPGLLFLLLVIVPLLVLRATLEDRRLS